MLIFTNLVFLYLVFIFVSQSGHATSNINFNQSNSVAGSSISPIDQVSSANIALTVAQMTNLPETTAITNQAQSQEAEISLASTNNEITPKPQVVKTALKSRANIFYYTVQTGDTLASLAAKFGITEGSISGSNSLYYGNLKVGQKLVIPPFNGLVYKVKAGDTPQSLANTYNVPVSQIISYNDAEISGIHQGELILIPNGVAPATNYAPSSYFPWGNGPIYGYNGYDFGWCTWYVATQIPVPSNWGNASTWAFYAALSGWNVSKTPSVGAIAQTANAFYGEGHVAIVDAVSADGSHIQYRDMNGVAGWDRVGYSSWVPATDFQYYITR